ncbi:hypothetical protein ACFST9_16505 [Hymenobacter monticola]|uniref:Uncharacterized protein n=2 Tax=Hymenobacter monticola TaxID=1705399 RepID=A0ABY4B440_9BACT|nr:hypothetical protein [Hymenobacter monticola]UOE32491.1 hypothetical protein MTP16_15275 [Hymenobacter monticola]
MPKNVDWYGGFVGLFPCIAIWAVSAVFVFIETSDSNRLQAIPAFIIFGLLCGYGIYCLLKEREVTPLETGLNLASNRKLAESAFNHLGWSIQQNNKHVIQAMIPSQWLGTGQVVVVLIKDGELHINTMNQSTGKGRLPFFLSDSREKTALFIRTVERLNLA